MPDHFDEIEARFGGAATADAAPSRFDEIEAKVGGAPEADAAPMDFETKRRVLRGLAGGDTAPGGTDLTYADTENPRYRHMIDVELDRAVPGARTQAHAAALLAKFPEPDYSGMPRVRSGLESPTFARRPDTSAGDVATTLAKRAAHAVTSPPAFLGELLLGKDRYEQLASEHLYAPGSGVGLSPEREAVARQAIEESGVGRAANMGVDLLGQMGSFKTLGRGLGAIQPGGMMASSGTMAIHGGLTGGGEGFGGGAIFGALAHGIEMPLGKWIERLPPGLKGAAVERLANAGAGGVSFAGADAVMNGPDAERAIANGIFGGALGFGKALAKTEFTKGEDPRLTAARGAARIQAEAEARKAAHEEAVSGEFKPGEPVEVTMARGQRVEAEAAERGAVVAKAIETGLVPANEAASPERVAAVSDAKSPEEARAILESMPAEKRPDGTISGPTLPYAEARAKGLVAEDAVPLADALEASGGKSVTHGHSAETGEPWVVGTDARGEVVRVDPVPEAPAAPREEVIQPRAVAKPRLKSADTLEAEATGKSLSQVVRAEGGIDLTKTNLQGEVNGLRLKEAGTTGLVRPNGGGKSKSIERMMDAVREQGFDLEGWTETQFVERVLADVEGDRMFSPQTVDAEKLGEAGFRRRTEQENARWEEMTPEQRVDAEENMAVDAEARGEMADADTSFDFGFNAPAPKPAAPVEPGFVLVGKTNKGKPVYRRQNYREGDPMVIRGEGGRMGAAHPTDVKEAKANALAEAARKPTVPEPPAPLPTVGEQLAKHAEAFVNPGGMNVSSEAGYVHPEILAAVGGKALELGKRAAGALRDAWTGLANKTFPKMTKENPEASAALASKVSTRVTAELFKRRVSEEVLGADVDPVEFGGALVEANLRDVRRRLLNEGDIEGAQAVVSTIGAEGAPANLATVDAWKAYLARPEVQAVIKRHNAMWERDVDPLYKAAQDIEESADLPTRGTEAGNARINLMRVDPEGKVTGGNGETYKPTGPVVGGQGNTGNLFTRKSPFGRRATGAAEGGYALDYREMMGNTYNRQATNAYYKMGLNHLVEGGDAVYVPRGTKAPESIKGEPVVMLDVKGPSGQRLAVRARFASELRGAIGLDAQPKFTPFVDGAVRMLNKTALVGITDNVIHTANTLAILMTRPMSGLSPTVDAAMSGALRSDLLVTMPRFTRNFFSGHERTAALEELANNSALSRGGVEKPTSLAGRLNFVSRIGSKIDVAARLTAYDAWKAMAKRGEVENTPASLREFVNQFGQYTSQATDPISRWLKQTGLAPFLVAGKRGLTTAIKTPTLSPGVKATATGTAVALRAAMLAKIAGTVGAIGLANYAKVGNFTGGPGVPMFALVTGQDDKTGETTYIDPLGWMGIRKAFNLYGGKYAETKRMGLSDSDAAESQLENVISALGFYVRGPAPDLVIKTVTGHGAGFHMPEYDKVGPDRNQLASNFKNALLDAPKSLLNVVGGAPNALGKIVGLPTEHTSDFINSITGQDKTADERMSEGLSYFGEKRGRTRAQQESLPDRARYAQFKEFEQDVYTKLVRLPEAKREQYLADRLDESALTDEEKARVRKRVAKYLPSTVGGK